MFDTWKQEKAIAALVDEAQALADKLAEKVAAGKPHFLDSHAAAAAFWAETYRAAGQDLHAMVDWPPAATARFIKATQAKIGVMRKARDYDSSDGLAIWLHTARAVTEPRIAPAVRSIWRQLMKEGPNVGSMADDLLLDAGLPVGAVRRAPKGFAPVEGDGQA
ncbi:hypothetical protein SAMN05216227_10791 [Pseudorhodobacter antarcticus]|jgi:hypothetical protein|uniref:Uncharacterized protein n=1 Tax=Pseudorhodobacter antarcticus TaxID=1077947 RepID=A0A1H8NDA8_9RHOB|nr:hypothetical protein [Pseudorhodobacter antarcticus]SEO27567.1 hypothetical protein SAMN05216227_10791 [Pseudorhodobacter antarcticus]